MVSHSYLSLTYNIKEIQQLLIQAVQIKVSYQMGLKKKKKSKCRRSFMSSNPVLFYFPLFVSLLSFMPLLMKCFSLPMGAHEQLTHLLLLPRLLSFLHYSNKRIAFFSCYSSNLRLLRSRDPRRAPLLHKQKNTLASIHLHSKLLK